MSGCRSVFCDCRVFYVVVETGCMGCYRGFFAFVCPNLAQRRTAARTAYNGVTSSRTWSCLALVVLSMKHGCSRTPKPNATGRAH